MPGLFKRKHPEPEHRSFPCPSCAAPLRYHCAPGPKRTTFHCRWLVCEDCGVLWEARHADKCNISGHDHQPAGLHKSMTFKGTGE